MGIQKFKNTFKCECHSGYLHGLPLVIGFARNPRLTCQHARGTSTNYEFRYLKVLTLRRALEVLEPNDEALGKGGELYQHLVRTKQIYSYCDTRFDTAVEDERGCIPEFQPGV